MFNTFMATSYPKKQAALAGNALENQTHLYNR